ncbi:hypothetical protein [Moritella sp. F3]|uniref:hypothetical protein n=1 Tax=Moritella sp. F3 TaxID=2718882 RepID=UPI0018E1C473|nr:hypothetical protein [Moritella sp. F3]GIC76961.1 hypothetical protein FMO001_16880 [Moritella sp. F1]GIC80144.1 hypothetical protein FMO003_04250 [Moritella sp. F3]
MAGIMTGIVIGIVKSKMHKLTLLGLSVFCLSSVQAAEQCKVSYPVVLTHHWGMKALCQSAPSEECDSLVPEKYCQQWEWDDDGQDQDCLSWRVPDDELHLPPRDLNLFEPSLQRDVSGYYRYFSQEIVQRLSQGCGNEVFIADNPAFASSLVRAKSLRNTVLQALDNTGADKVIIVGMSQGSQDARMLTQLSVSDGELVTSSMIEPNSSNELMASKVAALVTVVGENKGSWSASVFLNTMYAQRHLSRNWQWHDYRNNLIWQLGKSQLMTGLWRNNNNDYVLSENQLQVQTEADIYQQFLASNLVLTKKYMTGVAYPWVNWEQSWDLLRNAAGLNENNWHVNMPAVQELSNAIPYYSYAAQIHRWNKDWGQSGFISDLVALLEGPHDGYATVTSQALQAPLLQATTEYVKNNVKKHVKMMSGSALGSGYHHMFFSGRNDSLYGPQTSEQELDVYGGSSADFYQQIMVNLVIAGF